MHRPRVRIDIHLSVKGQFEDSIGQQDRDLEEEADETMKELEGLKDYLDLVKTNWHNVNVGLEVTAGMNDDKNRRQQGLTTTIIDSVCAYFL